MNIFREQVIRNVMLNCLATPTFGSASHELGSRHAELVSASHEVLNRRSAQLNKFRMVFWVQHDLMLIDK